MNDQFEQLLSYMRQSLSQGITEESLRQTLLQNNWDAEVVQKAFALVQNPTPSPNYQQPSTENSTPQAVGQIAQAQQAVPPPVNQPPSIVIPEKYRVTRSLIDTLRAIANNGVTYFLAFVISSAVSVGLLFLVTLIIKKVIVGDFTILFASNAKLLAILFGSLLLYTLWHAFAGAFVLATTSLALNDGADKHKSSIAITIRTSLKRVSRVILANALFVLVAIWPIILTIFLPAIFFTGGVESGASLLFVVLLATVAFAWAYIALIRFALAPYIALFEQDIPVIKTLARSKHLLVKGGQWFLVKGALLLFGLTVVVSLVTGLNLIEVTDSSRIVSNLFYIFVSILINGSLVMLYRNRRAVRN